MVISRVNHTSRKRINKNQCELFVEKGERFLLLTASLDLDWKKYPKDSKIVLEASVKQSFMRFELGTAADPLSLEKEPLTQFSLNSSSRVQFKFKVADPKGTLLASGLRLKPTRPEEDMTIKKGILPFEPDDSLGKRIWQLDLLREEPVVLINSDLENWAETVTSPEFVSFVYPEIVRSVARWEVNQKRSDGEESIWADFLKNIGHDPKDAPDQENETELEDWLDDICRTFADNHDLLDLLAKLEADD